MEGFDDKKFRKEVLSNHLMYCLSDKVYQPPIYEKFKKKAKVYSYEITLTTSRLFPTSLILSLEKISNSVYVRDSIDFRYSWELTKEGRPHIHILLVTKSILPSKKRLGWHSELWSKSLVRNIGAFEQYLLKTKNDQDVINYCKRFKLIHIYGTPENNKKENNEEISNIISTQ
jgi:hypothetical protein